MVNNLFPPGAPIATSTFLEGIVCLFEADLASLLVVKSDARQRLFTVLEGALHSAGSALYSRFHQQVCDEKAWATDIVAQRLYARCMRRPSQAFTYSSSDWVKDLDHQPSYTRTMLEALQSQDDLNSMVPVNDQMHCLLTIHRTRSGCPRFTRQQRRELVLLHEAFRDRIIDLRTRRLRDELPVPARATFSLLLAGHTEKEIAKLTHKSPNTVHDHVKRIYQHFEVSSRAQLLARFVDIERLQKFKM